MHYSDTYYSEPSHSTPEVADSFILPMFLCSAMISNNIMGGIIQIAFPIVVSLIIFVIVATIFLIPVVVVIIIILTILIALISLA